jgi:hypothetical protein
LQIRKIIVDSRTATVGTGSEFSIQLPETLNIPRGFGCYVTDVCVTHSFRTIHGGTSVGAKNHYLYFLERLWYPGGPSDYTVLNRATLTPGAYQPTELATEIQTRMNAVSFFGAAYTVSYSSSLQTMSITLAFTGDATYATYHGFQVLSTKILDDQTFRVYGEVRQLYNDNGVAFPGSGPTAYDVDWSDVQDASGLLSLDADKTQGAAVSALMTQIANNGTAHSWPKAQATGAVDVRNVHVLYVHSNALSNFSTLGPAGSRTVLARIPVTSLTGGVLFKQHSGNAHDYTDISGKCLRVLDFSVRNSHNQLVDLHGGHLSFELVFAPVPT